jgi:predicted phosphodiesterase
VGDWVFKTDTGLCRDAPIDAATSAAGLVALAARVELWHPHKRWFLLHGDGPGGRRWWPVSVCPRLQSLRSLSQWECFARLWARALNLAVARSRQHEVGLDLNPSNFGFQVCDACEEFGTNSGVWYLDDETYRPLESADVAEALVGRIPEWPRNSDATWQEFGVLLRGLLEPIVSKPRRWDQLCADIGEVLLAPRWEAARAALLSGIVAGQPRSSASRPQPRHPRRVGLIADVHANLPALEAVIARAEREGVDGWMFLGDAVGYGPQPRECVARLAALPNLIAVRGNHDHMACFGVEPHANEMARKAMHYTRATLDDWECRWLAALPIEQRGEGWVAVHGAPIDPTRMHAYVYAMSCRQNLDHLVREGLSLCFNGHTHVPMVYRRTPAHSVETLRPREGTSVDLRSVSAAMINPGSVGQPRDGDARASFAIWDRDAQAVKFLRVEYAVGDVIASIRRLGLADDLALRLELGR